MSETAAKDSGWDLPSAVPSPATSTPTSDSPPRAPREAASRSSSGGTPPPHPQPHSRPDAPAPSAASASASSPPKLVLIVEDDRTARRAIALILQRQGFAVSEAATVAEAMACLAARTPAWMLLDLMLPDGCGSEVLRKVRKNRLPTKTCIITG